MEFIDKLDWQGPVLVVPGLQGSGDEHWQTRWERRFPQLQRVHQQDWSVPDLDRWARAIVEAALPLAEPALVIAHSFGCLATIRAEVFQSSLIAGALLVAPADPEKFGVQPRLPRLPLTFQSTLVASRDDPWMPFEIARDWAERWGSEFRDAGWCGHINVAAGVGDWPEGQLLLQQLCRRMNVVPETQRLRRPATLNPLALSWAA